MGFFARDYLSVSKNERFPRVVDRYGGGLDATGRAGSTVVRVRLIGAVDDLDFFQFFFLYLGEVFRPSVYGVGAVRSEKAVMSVSWMNVRKMTKSPIVKVKYGRASLIVKGSTIKRDECRRNRFVGIEEGWWSPRSKKLSLNAVVVDIG